ncbi:MAG: hypothetical protein K2O67_02760, partial [Clostridia bacterium]|nr:hypothetical protein [Clostridia bacterium]
EMKGRFKAAVILATVSAVCGVGGAVTAFADSATGTAYYVCYSNENYAVRNANKLAEKDGEYVLSNVRLNSLISFYVTDNAGRRWYAGDGKEMQVEETANYYYDIKFSPENTYGTEDGGWEKTDCHITYAFYIPAQYSVNIGGAETPLTYNPYRTNYEEYFLSSQYITGGTDVIYGSETHNIADDGYYRILYTPGEISGGNSYAYDENGNYGTGEKFTYNLYIQDAPQYFLLPEGGTEYIPLTRNENNVAASEYQSEEFFIAERDTTYRYAVYEMQTDGAYRLIDDDGDEDTALSKITEEDAGWYKFSFTDGGNVFTTSLKRQKRNFKGFYLAGEFNNYCFDGQGNVYTDEDSRLIEIADGDDDYDKDFKQFVLYLTVSERHLKYGDFEFYITD